MVARNGFYTYFRRISYHFRRGRVGCNFVKVASGCRTCGFSPGQNQSFEAALVFLERRETRFYTYFQLKIDIEKTPLSAVMTTNLSTANIDDRISDSLRRMSQGRFRHMPVIDNEGNLKGLLSQGDFVAYTLSDAIYRAGITARAELKRAMPLWIAVTLGLGFYTALLVYVLSLF